MLGSTIAETMELGNISSGDNALTTNSFGKERKRKGVFQNFDFYYLLPRTFKSRAGIIFYVVFHKSSDSK